MVARLTLVFLLALGLLLPVCLVSVCRYVYMRWTMLNDNGYLQALGLLFLLAGTFALSSAAVRLVQELFALRHRFRGAVIRGEDLFIDISADVSRAAAASAPEGEGSPKNRALARGDDHAARDQSGRSASAQGSSRA